MRSGPSETVELDQSGNRGSWLALIFWVVLSLGAGFVGALSSPPGAWYASLNKPSWNPPNWIFGPVWTALYVLMGVAVWMVWSRRKVEPIRAGAGVRLFLVQLALNAAWSWLFFGIRRPDLAFVELIVLWVLILMMVVAFLRVRPMAGLLVLPYLAWVSFAGVLNATIWLRNMTSIGSG